MVETRYRALSTRIEDAVLDHASQVFRDTEIINEPGKNGFLSGKTMMPGGVRIADLTHLVEARRIFYLDPDTKRYKLEDGRSRNLVNFPTAVLIGYKLDPSDVQDELYKRIKKVDRKGDSSLSEVSLPLGILYVGQHPKSKSTGKYARFVTRIGLALDASDYLRRASSNKAFTSHRIADLVQRVIPSESEIAKLKVILVDNSFKIGPDLPRIEEGFRR